MSFHFTPCVLLYTWGKYSVTELSASSLLSVLDDGKASQALGNSLFPKGPFQNGLCNGFTPGNFKTPNDTNMVQQTTFMNGFGASALSSAGQFVNMQYQGPSQNGFVSSRVPHDAMVEICGLQNNNNISVSSSAVEHENTVMVEQGYDSMFCDSMI